MFGVILDAAAVFIGGILGLLLKKGIPEKYSGNIMTALGLCTIVIGINGALSGDSTLVMIVAMVLGVAFGSFIDIDRHFNNLGAIAEKLVPANEKNGSVAQSFVAASLLVCVGAMDVVGSLQAGLTGDLSILYTKSMLDFISGIFMALSLGVGVVLSSVSVLVVQGSFVLLAHLLAPVLTDAMIAEMSCVGSVLIFALGLNLINVTKFKIANFLPSIAFAPVISWLFTLLNIR